jgi:predicted O-methyltransferase YrrM
MSSIQERRALKDMAPSVRLDEVHTQNCRVLPTRMHLLGRLPRGGVVAEIGVAFGHFTTQILERNKPKKLHLVDAWASKRYQQGLAQIRERFSQEIAGGAIEVHQGLSTECLPDFDQDYFDWVYIDTDHSYATTRDELLLSAQKVKPGGLISGHDFTSGNPVRAVPYGVIEACNEFCVQQGWEYAFITLEPSGHFSFALARLGSGSPGSAR